MKGAQRLMFVAALALGFLFGLGAQRGVERVSGSSSVEVLPTLSEPDRVRLPGEGDGTAAGSEGGEHRVRILFPIFPNENVQAVGVWGACDESVPDAECLFEVQAVQYHRDPNDSGATKFNVVCVDLSEYPNFSDDVPSCSPMERQSIEIGVGPSFAVNVGGEGGVAAGLFGGLEAGVDAGLGFSVPIVVHRKFRYPIQRARFGGRMGGNILMESGIGSILASRSVIFGHSNFDGSVVFFITKPVGMSLLFGSYGSEGARCYDGAGGPADCPSDQPGSFTAALHHVCGIGNVGGCGGSSAAAESTTALGAGESDFDIQEVIDALDDESRAIQDISDELRGRIKEKVAEVFETIREYLGSADSSASLAERTEVVDRMMSLLRERIPENLQEIRDIAKDLVLCPE